MRALSARRARTCQSQQSSVAFGGRNLREIPVLQRSCSALALALLVGG